MNANLSPARRSRLFLFAASLSAAIFPMAADAGAASSHSSASVLVGAWGVQVTLRDCATGAPLGPPFNSLVSAHEGGTMSENAASLAFAPGQRTAGHGTWARIGRRTYRQNMIALILFDTAPNLPGTPTFDPSLPVSPGFFAGSVTISHTIVLSNANNFTSSGTNAFYREDGTVYRTGCSTAVGQRFH
jgi:hypothetical protein